MIFIAIIIGGKKKHNNNKNPAVAPHSMRSAFCRAIESNADIDELHTCMVSYHSVCITP